MGSTGSQACFQSLAIRALQDPHKVQSDLQCATVLSSALLALEPALRRCRLQVAGPGMPPGDFIIQGPVQHGVPRLVNLYGIESPGLTASLAIAEEVAALLGD
jgi:hypothetical protein